MKRCDVNPFSPGSFLHSLVDKQDEPTSAPEPVEPFLPSAEHIATETARLRSNWNEAEHLKRAGLRPSPLTVLVVKGGGQ